jgi:hypothetical protein
VHHVHGVLAGVVVLIGLVAGGQRDHGLAQHVFMAALVRALCPLETCCAIFSCSRARACGDRLSERPQ